MNKKVFVILFLLVSFSVNAKYVRKLKEPDFFIPEIDKMHKIEKLPVMNIKSDVIKKEIYKKPDYKKKYDEYLRDVNVFAKTRTMPENNVLQNDLASMNTGDVFEVEESSFDYSNYKEYVKFEKILKNILK